MVKTLKAVRFLFVGPLILLLLFVINWMTSPGDWWVQWAALGIGIAWVISLIRVLSALLMVGGLAAVGAWLMRRSNRSQGAGTPPPPPKY
jgi:hypothetical protein